MLHEYISGWKSLLGLLVYFPQSTPFGREQKVTMRWGVGWGGGGGVRKSDLEPQI